MLKVQFLELPRVAHLSFTLAPSLCLYVIMWLLGIIHPSLFTAYIKMSSQEKNKTKQQFQMLLEIFEWWLGWCLRTLRLHSNNRLNRRPTYVRCWTTSGQTNSLVVTGVWTKKMLVMWWGVALMWWLCSYGGFAWKTLSSNTLYGCIMSLSVVGWKGRRAVKTWVSWWFMDGASGCWSARPPERSSWYVALCCFSHHAV